MPARGTRLWIDAVAVPGGRDEDRAAGSLGGDTAPTSRAIAGSRRGQNRGSQPAPRSTPTPTDRGPPRR